MFKFILTTLFLSLYFFSSSSISEQKQKCLSMHVIFNAPGGYIDETGKAVGYHFDFLTALEERSGSCIDKTLLPYSRARRSIELGEHDGGLLLRSTNLDPYVEYIVKLVTSRTVIIPKKGISLDSYDDLTNITFGKLRGTNLNERLENDPNISFIKISSYEQGLKMLKKGRIDAIVGNERGLSYIENNDIANDVNLSGKFVVGQREVWLVLSKKSENLDKAKQLKRAAQALINEGVFENILTKHIGKY